MMSVPPSSSTVASDGAAAPDALPRWRPSGEAKAAHTDAPKDVVAALGLASGDVDDRLTQYGDEPDTHGWITYVD